MAKANNLLKYKGYVGSYEVCFESGTLSGKLEFINALVTFEAVTPTELKNEFELAVDDYLETCKELGYQPEKSLSGSFNVRIGSELHKEVAVRALESGCSINQIIVDALESSFNEGEVVTHNHNHVHHVVSQADERVDVSALAYGKESLASPSMPLWDIKNAEHIQ